MADLGFSDSSDDEREEAPVEEAPPPSKKIDVRKFIDDAAEDQDEEGNDEAEVGEDNEDYEKVR